MRYMGGKSKLGKHIARWINRSGYTKYLEPFVGSGAVLEHVTILERSASDLNSDLISMYTALQNGWLPPVTVSKEDYAMYKANPSLLDNDTALRAFISIGCSFGGKIWGGYAQYAKRDIPNETARNLEKQLPKIKNVVFQDCHYQEYQDLRDTVIYCDPPYAGTTQYKGFENFDYDEFWNTVRMWSKNNTVIVSEYTAPDDMFVLQEWQAKTTLTKELNVENKRIEKLFYIGNEDNIYMKELEKELV